MDPYNITTNGRTFENLIPIDAAAILSLVLDLPIYSYNTPGSDMILKSCGPLPSDIQDKFRLVPNSSTIDGITLAAIKQLAENQRNILNRMAKIEECILILTESITKMEESIADQRKLASRLLDTLN